MNERPASVASLAEAPPLSPEDETVVAGQLGRQPRDVTGIPVRCRFGFPVVIETAPIMSDDTPNPTLFYLVCPALTVLVSRLESKRGVRSFKAACAEDPALKQAIEQVASLYRARRAGLAGDREDQARLDAGIGGPAGPEVATCLHSHAAALLAVRSGWLPADPALAQAVEEVWERFYPDSEEPWCTDRRCACWTGAERRAVIDVGTISVRLFVADVEGAAVAAGGAERGANHQLGAAQAAPVAENATFAPGAAPPGGAQPQVAVPARVHGAPQPAGGPVQPSDGAAPAPAEGGAPQMGAPNQQRYDDVIRRTEITRLGEGLNGGQQLLPAAKARTAAVVGRFVGQARFLGAKHILLTATSAGREASDGAQFIASLGKAHDIRSMVLTGLEEADLAYTGVSLGIPGNPVLLDVGGGSTELVIARNGDSIDSISLDLGANRATGAWIHHDPPLEEEIDAIRAHARELLEPLRSRFSRLAVASSGPGGPAEPARLVGVAGTIATLACLDGGMERYSKALVHLYRLRRDAVARLLDLLARMTLEERTTFPCMMPGRAAVIVAGTAIVLTAMETLGFDELTISEHDLLDGLMLKGFDLRRDD